VRLLRLKADGFGPLRGEYRLATDRVTLLVDDNERGKSSLLAAVHAALYGLEDDKRTHRLITPLERWRPWDGGSFRLELELERNGERYTIIRDFDRGTTEVWNHRGQELSHQFRDAHPVGQWLLQLDAEEFQKCAFVRQGEIERVVEDEERQRRASTLRARLESAADSKSGDSTAAEALRALDDAATRYTCNELTATVKVETAIDRLDAKCRLLESEMHTLAHDLDQSAGPLEELSSIGDEERVARERLAALETERRVLRALEARDRLTRDAALEDQIAELMAEAEALEPLAEVDPGADSELRHTVARYEEACLRLEAIETRVATAEAERQAMEAELEPLSRYANGTAADADLFAARARELERLEATRDDLELALERQYTEFGARGFDETRIEWLVDRFSTLDDEPLSLLRSQPHLILVFERSFSEAAKARAECAEKLAELGARRQRRLVPGWITLALGSAAAGAGIAALAVRMGAPWPMLLPTGGLLFAIGGVLLITGALGGRKERDELLDRMSEADAHIEQLTRQRAENEGRLNELAGELECEDPGDLMRNWSDYVRYLADGDPLRQTRLQISDLDHQREEIEAEVHAALTRLGLDADDPISLHEAAEGIRHRIEATRRVAEFSKGTQWAEIERMTAQTSVAELGERSAEILRSAGMVYDAGRAWAEQIDAVTERVKLAARRQWLISERIPELGRQRLDAAARANLSTQATTLDLPAEASAIADAAEAVQSLDAVDAEIYRTHERIQEILARRGDLRVAVDEVWRRYHADYPAKEAELAQLTVALERARRFKDAVTLARETLSSVAADTHRRWADFLNQRVSEILATFGSSLGDLRFGEDLDFALRLSDRAPVSRGRAVQQLSAGARDQLHLAVRLAISEYLSRDEEPLPLLVDDCFATSDDERTRAGMRLLIEHFAHRHQILFVTCHRRRYAELASLDPDLYDRRVNWVELRTTPVT